MIQYKIIISAIWWGAGLTIISVFLWLTTNNSNFGNFSSQALDWLLPQLIPTMTLTGAVAFAQRKSTASRRSKQVRWSFILTCAASVFYLGLVVADIAQAFVGTTESERGVLDALNSWNKVLGIFQGLAASSIGVFFVRGDGDKDEGRPPSRP